MSSPSSPSKPKPGDSCHPPNMAAFLIPSPIVTRRTRTSSTSRLTADAPVKKGNIVTFDRSRGHGFIKPEGEDQPEIFCHISDIEGEIVPMHDDLVTYKECPIPPKKTKVQAVEVNIVHLAPGKHKRWVEK